MSNRLEVLVNGMNPLAKWGCGATFMAITFGIIWVVSFYTYHVFWITNVGKDEYREVLAELPQIQTKLNQIESTAAVKAEIQGLVTQFTTNILKQEDLAPIRQQNDALRSELAALRTNELAELRATVAELRGSIAALNSANLTATQQLSTDASRILQLQEEAILLKSALASIARSVESNHGNR